MLTSLNRPGCTSRPYLIPVPRVSSIRAKQRTENTLPKQCLYWGKNYTSTKWLIGIISRWLCCGKQKSSIWIWQLCKFSFIQWGICARSTGPPTSCLQRRTPRTRGTSNSSTRAPSARNSWSASSAASFPRRSASSATTKMPASLLSWAMPWKSTVLFLILDWASNTK